MPTTAMLVSDLLTDVRAHFNDIDQPSYLAHLNEVNGWVLYKARIVSTSSLVISLTAGTAGYALDSGISRIWDAVYYSDASSFFQLLPTSIDELDLSDTLGETPDEDADELGAEGLDEGPLWRQMAQGTPNRYLLDGTNLVLLPPPDTSTVAGFPNVTVYHGGVAPALLIGSSLPALPISPDVYRYGVCRLWAAKYHRDQYPFFNGCYREALRELQGFVNRRDARQNPRIQARFPRIRPV